MKSFALVLLRAYKRHLSPMMPVACRYVPTCSDYAMEAIERYGALRGGAQAIGRFLRCNPWGGHGFDPVSNEPCNSHGCTPLEPEQSLPADDRISKQYGRA
jgi:putative membrane protein insertion efficiency factor